MVVGAVVVSLVVCVVLSVVGTSVVAVVVQTAVVVFEAHADAAVVAPDSLA